MAGKTDVLVGFRNGSLAHVPIGTVVKGSKQLAVEGDRWVNVQLATGQPRWPARAE